MQRHGSVIRLRPGHEVEYRRLHAEVWPQVLAQIDRSNIRNYSIFLHAGVLFSYFEYVGEDFDRDMADMAADPVTQDWWEVCKPMQEPLESRGEGEWWAEMREVFHHDG